MTIYFDKNDIKIKMQIINYQYIIKYMKFF